ncbi:MAG TPA: cation-translocating P-type ATPase [Methylomusa anaerophila]|uniref:P-type Ca(2+) transporter n=1 Tax=Methylomusa anaerophila TaxID=1930071 RepID=A0A348AFX0_9FIRM|nr:cation-translocating P-type ATPase [Methylomusa anaerophila]BBB89968.1 calcium-transporting ATPase 1 [Methylomusa anaerophila]HML88305.1 cation-translocating P-type ATPase [Methylomusa anaerophila]
MKPWFQMMADETIRQLESEAVRGLSSAEAAGRLAEHGYNELTEKEQESLWQKFLAQFKNVLVLILVAASGISVLIGEAVDSLVIIAIVILNAVLGVFQESRAERALAALKKMNAAASKVIRDGAIVVIPARELVPGDIALLDAGDYVPADMRILESVNLKIEEASLTGESVPVDKDSREFAGDIPLAERHNMAFMGTIVTYGRGRGIVVATAMQTEIGKIAGMLHSVAQELTPLQKKLAEFGKILAMLCLGVCTVVFGIGIYHGYFNDGILALAEIQDMLMVSISLAVAAIPEGLPAIVAMVLAFGMQRMAKKNAIVKKLHTVETLGSVSVICTDKTGTLTQNQMMVAQIFIFTNMFTVSGYGYKPEGKFLTGEKPVRIDEEEELALLLQASLLCNDAELRQSPADQTWSVVGDPTEGALLVAAAKGGYRKDALSAQYPRIQEFPFDSGRKMMTTFHQADGKILAFSKGAPDILLSRCTRTAASGTIRPLTNSDKEAIRAANQEMASQALRVLAVAYRDFDQAPDLSNPDGTEKDLIMIGLVGMIDPPRSEAKLAVEICRQAGIRTTMITGDHPETAFAIAKYLGIAGDGQGVITGRMLDTMPAEELRQQVRRASVFARVSPEHKLAIVDALQTSGFITAMTGDGVNDAPALKKADIGVAMGITGTDVAKATADMVITDDNFATIVSAVEEGRVIYANIRKFVYFLLSCNTAEVVVIFFAMLLGWPVPLLPTQLLWVNLVTDGFPALALGLEKKEPNVMRLKPRDPAEPLLTGNMRLLIGIQSLVMSITVLFAFQYGLMASNGNLAIAHTFAFITLMATQIICAYAARSERYSVFQLGVFSNRYLNMGVALSFLLMLLSVYGPLQEVFKTVRPELKDWLILGALAPIPFIAAELTKFGSRLFFKTPK